MGSRHGIWRLAIGAAAVLIVGLAMCAAARPAHALQPTADGRWFWQMPQPAALWYSALDSPDGASAWAGAESGTILHTSDGGLSWQTQLTNTSAGIVAVSAVDAQVAFAVGSFPLPASEDETPRPDIMLRTSDGGATWDAAEFVAGGPASANALDFVDAEHGWAVGSGVFVTSDGGVTWARQTLSTTNSMTSVCFVDEDHGWAGDSEGVLYRTTNGGATWTSADLNMAGIGAIVARDADNVWALGEGEPYWEPYGKLLQSLDGGRTWVRRFPKLAAEGGATSLHFDADGVGFLAVEGTIWTTTDSGATWAPRSELGEEGLTVALAGRASASLFAAGPYSLCVSRDGGRCWPSALGALGEQDTVDLVALPGHTGWRLANAYGSVEAQPIDVFRCRDGLRWQKMTTINWASALDFVDLDHGFVVADGGKVHRTADGGATWAVSELGTDYWLTAVEMLNDQVGWVAGNKTYASPASVWRTTDGGASWTLSALASRAWPSDLSFVDELHGWAATANFSGGKVLRTTDGGVTWQDVTPSGRAGNAYGAVEFVDQSHGWVLVTNRDSLGAGQVLHTDDGGTTWQPTAGAGWREVNDIAFSDALHGYVVGGPSYYTEDGGQTWQESSLPAAPEVVSFAADGSGLIGVGDYALFSSWNPDGDNVAPNVASWTPWWSRTDATVDVAALDIGGSGVASVEYRVGEAAWQEGTRILLPGPPDHSGDGIFRVRMRATDNAGNVSKTVRRDVGVDTRGPRTRALERVGVRRGVVANLPCRVGDELSPFVTVTIKIRDKAGVCRRTLTYQWMLPGTRLTASFRCWLPRGRYTYEVRARDLAGNTQRVMGTNVLVVR